MIICGAFLFSSCFNLIAQGPIYSKVNYFLGIFGMFLTRKLVDVSGVPFSRDFPLNQEGLHSLLNPSRLQPFVVYSVYDHEDLLRKSQEVFKDSATMFS